MSSRILILGLGFALLGAAAEDAAASARWPNCRPYTVERTCPPGQRLCSLKMVYAPRQSPAVDAKGYWYGTPRPSAIKASFAQHRKVANAPLGIKTAKVVKQSATPRALKAAAKRKPAMGCGYRCWYRHWPEHNLSFGD